MKNFRDMLIRKYIDKIVENPYEHGIAIAPIQDGEKSKTFQKILKETYEYSYSSLRDYPYCTHMIVYTVFPEKVNVDLYAMTGVRVLTMSHSFVIPQGYEYEMLHRTYIATLLEAVLKHEGGKQFD